ncbi:MAG: hypothetical protein VB118_00540 [Oscillospiraceae bacterium]|nr:hypothetical protein [Oscillospiraceae bacterium]
MSERTVNALSVSIIPLINIKTYYLSRSIIGGNINTVTCDDASVNSLSANNTHYFIYVDTIIGLFRLLESAIEEKSMEIISDAEISYNYIK